MSLISTCQATPVIHVKRGEAKTVVFTITDKDGNAVDCNSTTVSFVVEDRDDQSVVLTKDDASFDKTGAANGILRLALSSTDLDQAPDEYTAELKIIFTASSIDKSVDIDFIVDRAITT